MIREVYGKKIGMTQIFDEEGNLIAATLLEVEPMYVLEKVEYPTKIKAKIGCFKIKGKKADKIKKPIAGYFNKLKVSPYKLIQEVEVEEGADFSFNSAEKGEQKQEQSSSSENSQVQDKDIDAKVKTGESPKGNPKGSDSASSDDSDSREKRALGNPREIGVEIFSEGDVVDVRAKTKGRGFAGGMKRHGWSGGPKSHGSTTHRRVGSVGASAYPSKIVRGHRMPGHMGNKFRTTKNLKILRVDRDKEVLFINGSIPGSRGTVVRVRKVN